MRGSELRTARELMGLDELTLARAIGYTGSDRNDVTRIREYERGKKQIPLYIARSVWMIRAYWLRGKRLPLFPNWPGYDFESRPDPKERS